MIDAKIAIKPKNDIVPSFSLALVELYFSNSLISSPENTVSILPLK